MRLREEAITKSKTIDESITPQSYNPQEKYPLLIVLHGGGSSIKKEKKHWISERLKNEFVIVFIQSYLYYDMSSYGWLIADERARNDLRSCFNEIKDRYHIDTNKVIIGGISAGGYTAMDITINNIFPTNGFIAICPDVTADDFKMNNIKKAKQLGIRGVIISGENDYNINDQKQLLEKFNEVEFHYKFEMVIGMGHEYPKDFEARIDSAIKYFLGCNDINYLVLI
jgi:predicted peptidase